MPDRLTDKLSSDERIAQAHTLGMPEEEARLLEKYGQLSAWLTSQKRASTKEERARSFVELHRDAVQAALDLQAALNTYNKANGLHFKLDLTARRPEEAIKVGRTINPETIAKAKATRAASKATKNKK